jgi:hypothetical protein
VNSLVKTWYVVNFGEYAWLFKGRFSKFMPSKIVSLQKNEKLSSSR